MVVTPLTVCYHNGWRHGAIQPYFYFKIRVNSESFRLKLTNWSQSKVSYKIL